MDDKQQKLTQNASKIARQNIRFLWREQFWNLRREGGTCEHIAVLCTVSDEINGEKIQEQFWLSDIMCDGSYIYGSVTAEPAIIKEIAKGAICTVPIDRIEDWIYVINNKVYGGYTINTQRSFLSGQELTMYDQGWGFDFGNALYIEKYPIKKKTTPIENNEEEKPPTKFFGITLQKKAKNKPVEEQVEIEEKKIDRELDHPDALSRYHNYENRFRSHPENVNALDQNGWTPLHNHSLAGNRHIVKLLIECGADTQLETSHGHTALDLAKIMGWMEVVRLLS